MPGIIATIGIVLPSFLIMTIVLAGVMLGAKTLPKKKISPVMLIVLSAVLGMILYGGRSPCGEAVSADGANCDVCGSACIDVAGLFLCI